MFVPILTAAIPGLIGLAEHLFPKKAPDQKTGEQKKDWVMAMLGDVWDILAERGHIPPPAMPARDAILEILSSLIDRSVAAMKEKHA